MIEFRHLRLYQGVSFITYVHPEKCLIAAYKCALTQLFGNTIVLKGLQEHLKYYIIMSRRSQNNIMLSIITSKPHSHVLRRSASACHYCCRAAIIPPKTGEVFSALVGIFAQVSFSFMPKNVRLLCDTSLTFTFQYPQLRLMVDIFVYTPILATELSQQCDGEWNGRITLLRVC